MRRRLHTGNIFLDLLEMVKEEFYALLKTSFKTMSKGVLEQLEQFQQDCDLIQVAEPHESEEMSLFSAELRAEVSRARERMDESVRKLANIRLKFDVPGAQAVLEE